MQRRHRMIRTLAVALALSILPLEVAAGERRLVTIGYGAGRSMTVTVVFPTAYDPAVRHPVLLALPPGAGDQDMVDAFLGNYWMDEADRRNFVLVSPAVRGAGLELSGEAVVEAIFGWMDVHINYDPARVTLAGQSNGGLGAFHLARVAPDRFASIVVMPGGYGGAGSLDPLAGKPVWLLVGERDRNWLELAFHTRDFLLLAGAEPRLEVVPGGEHVFGYPADRLYDWIVARHPK